jgi:hypothetical protein
MSKLTLRVIGVTVAMAAGAAAFVASFARIDSFDEGAIRPVRGRGDWLDVRAGISAAARPESVQGRDGQAGFYPRRSGVDLGGSFRVVDPRAPRASSHPDRPASGRPTGSIKPPSRLALYAFTSSGPGGLLAGSPARIWSHLIDLMPLAARSPAFTLLQCGQRAPSRHE